MSTPTERLEAEVWLDSMHPGLPAETRARFFVAVDDYYRSHPTAERGTDFLAVMIQDSAMFARILDSLIE